MALAALLGGSFLGTLGGVIAWLFVGLSGVQALAIYLLLGLVMPVVLIAVVTLLSSREIGAATPLQDNRVHTA